MELKKYKLKDVCTIIPGFAFKAEDFGKGDNIAIKITDIQPPKINVENASTVATTPKDKRIKLNKGDFVMAMTGATIGKIGLFDSEKQNVYINQRVCKFEIKDGFSKEYLYYVLNLPMFRKFIFQNVDSSSAQPNIGHPTIYNFEFEVPTLQTQRRIAHVLSTLDRKISLNRSINAELERMAKEIYDYWFVQFEFPMSVSGESGLPELSRTDDGNGQSQFPDANGRPYKSSGGAMVYNPVLKREVPEGWEVKTLKDIISSNRGISYNTQSISGGGVPMINLASFNTDGTYKHQGLKLYNGDYTEEKVVHPLDLVLCNTQQTALDEKKDIIGKCFLVPFLFQGDIVCSHHVNIIRTTNKLFKPYLAYLSNTKHFHKFASGCCSGTNIMGLNFDTLQQYKIEIPSRMILEKFYDFVLNIEMQKGILSQEIIQLEDQRDELLPLLMTGQVKIK